VLLTALLATTMLVTRGSHFDALIGLPDASLAVFFFAGLALPGFASFGLLLALAAGIDLFAVNAADVAADCFTPAYPWLALAYGCLWFAGMRARAHARVGASALHVIVASTLAFAISNLSFFAFSGQFPTLSLERYVAATWQYALPYVGYTCVYVAIGALCMQLARPSGARQRA
jgi:uncharacterized membrane protein